MPVQRTKTTQLTPLELAIMQVLWSEGPCNVQAVQRKLAGEPAYTTVQTMLNVLQRKGRVKRTLIGRAYEYRPVDTQEKALGGAVHDLLNRMFGGSVEDLLMNMVKTRQIDAKKLEILAQKIALAQKKEASDADGE